MQSMQERNILLTGKPGIFFFSKRVCYDINKKNINEHLDCHLECLEASKCLILSLFQNEPYI